MEPFNETANESPDSHTAATKSISLRIDNGLGDFAHIGYSLQLWKNRGYEIFLEGGWDTRLIWKAAGVNLLETNDQAPFYRYEYRDEFRDISQPEWISSKIGRNLTNPFFPQIGEGEALWNELCEVRLDCMPFVPEETIKYIEERLSQYPKPWIAWSTQGISFEQLKCIPQKVASDAALAVLNETGGTLFVLNLRNREPVVEHQLYKSWKSVAGGMKRCTLESLAALYSLCDLVVGVDSGPFHFASLTPAKCLGLFRKMPPVSCCIPNPNAVYFVSATNHADWEKRKEQWNFKEYAGEEPTAEDITLAVLERLTDDKQIKKEVQQPTSEVPEVSGERDPVFSRPEENDHDLLVQQQDVSELQSATDDEWQE